MTEEEANHSLEVSADQWLSHGIHSDWGAIYLGEITPEAAERVCKGLFLCRWGIRVYINSPGGSVDDGKAIYDLIKSYSAESEAIIIGQASSIAAVIVQAFNVRIIAPSAVMLLHDGTVSDENHARDFEQTALQSKRDRIWCYQTLASRCGRTSQYWQKVFQRDTYYNAKDAMRLGLVDKILTVE